MSTAKQDDSIHRLLDIVVEEVSLVDRAANKHRFLIVKRSDPMEENHADKAKNPTGEAVDAANAGCEGLPFRHNGERSCPQCVALYERARKNGMPASGRHG